MTLSLYTHTYIYKNTFIYEKLSTHMFMKQPWKIIYSIFPLSSHMILIF